MAPVTTWRALVDNARERFSRLRIPDSIFQNAALAQEPFETAIRDRIMVLLAYLNDYMNDRAPGGAEGERARQIIRNFFVGERAHFTGESPSNQRKFKSELTFPDPEFPSRFIFAHWHAKISHRFFRVHFQWPVPSDATKLSIVYIGPKLTKG